MLVLALLLLLLFVVIAVFRSAAAEATIALLQLSQKTAIQCYHCTRWALCLQEAWSKGDNAKPWDKDWLGSHHG